MSAQLLERHRELPPTNIVPPNEGELAGLRNILTTFQDGKAEIIPNVPFDAIQALLTQEIQARLPASLIEQFSLKEKTWIHVGNPERKDLPFMFFGYSPNEKDQTIDTASATLVLTRGIHGMKRYVYADNVLLGGTTQDSNGFSRAVGVRYGTREGTYAHHISCSVSSQEYLEPTHELGWKIFRDRYDFMHDSVELPTKLAYPEVTGTIITAKMLESTGTPSNSHTRGVRVYDAGNVGVTLRSFGNREIFEEYAGKMGFQLTSDSQTHTLHFSPRQDQNVPSWELRIPKSLQR